jgi:hypothetical protein
MDDKTKADLAAIEAVEYEIQEKQLQLAGLVKDFKKSRKFSPNSGINREDGTEVKQRSPVGAARPGGTPQPLPR